MCLMNRDMKRNSINIIAILSVFLAPTVGFSQILPPPVPPPPPPGLSIDRYTFFLVVIAVIYGLKKIYKS